MRRLIYKRASHQTAPLLKTIPIDPSFSSLDPLLKLLKMRKIRKEPFNLTTPWTEKMGALVLDQTPHHRDHGEREPASSDPSITHRTSLHCTQVLNIK